ncbi:MAG: TonB-dependent receptor [Flavobacteriia bacterium]|jgi:hypothetical protein
MKSLFTIFIALFSSITLFAQSGTLIGNVKDKNTQELLFGAKVFVENTSIGALTDENGNYKLSLETGTYNIKVIAVGYVPQTQYNIVVSSGGVQQVNFELVNSVTDLKEVTITDKKDTKAATTDMITPLSVQQLTTEEIKSNPGGGFDVSKVVQTLPGIGSSGGGAPRNDIIVRGGAPNENVYYLDGIEIPVLNHFQTQGSSGGAQGILNVTFIEDLKLSSSAFDARYDNALASTFVIKQRQGNSEKVSGNLRTSLTESAFTLEGPLSKSKKNNFLLSSRFSYLDLLFTLIDLPIRPRYSDFQYKVTHKFSNKTTLTAIGIGAIDKFSFGATKNSSPENEYFRRSLPFIEQWNYTTGFNVKHLIKKGYMNFSLSRNMFNNEINRYEDARNDEEEFKNLGLVSQEIENKFRFDFNKYVNGWKYSFGVMGQYVKYNTDFYSKLSNAVYDTNGVLVSPTIEFSSKSAIEFFKYGAFGQVSKNFFNEKLLVSGGLRSDMNNFLEDGNNFLKTISPRLSVAFHVNKKFDISASVGSYYKIPTYTTLGYRDANNVLVNKNLQYINSKHYVFGGQYLPNESLRITLEGFYKTYSNYPVSVSNGISLGNQGSEFGAVGNEAVTSIGKGETYGFEVFVQQKLVKKIFYFASYSFVRSFYSGADDALIASAWDNQHLLSATVGYKLKKNWQIGVKYRLAGGVPYTPFNLDQSQATYATTGVGFLDYTNLNSQRLEAFNQVDLRIDKIANFKKFTLTFFIDIQNLLLNAQQGTPYYTFQRNADNSAFETTDGQALKVDGSNGIPLVLENSSKNVTPSLGLIFDF